jgi:signal transduction histidine kinase
MLVGDKRTERGKQPYDVRSEQVSLVVGQLPLVLAANVINPILIAAILSEVVPAIEVSVWAALLVGLAGVRFIQLRGRETGILTNSDPRRLTLRLAAASGVSGCLWGVGLTILLPDPLLHRLFVTFVLGGMAAGAVATLSPLLPVVTAFLLPCMLPLALRLAMEGEDPVYLGMGVLALLFTGGLWLAAWKLNGWITEMLRLKAEKIDLAEELSSVLGDLERQVEQRTADLRAARDDADRANQAKTRLLAAASHDLGQPFQAMRLFIDLLEKQLAGSRHEEYLRRLAQAHDSGERMLASLLDLSRLETGAVEVRTESFAINPLLERLAGEFQPLASSRRLGLKVRPNADIVLSDPVLLHQILSNLLANALRYTPAGRVLLACRRRGGQLRVEIWDTGIGIPSDRLDDIFEEFRRIDQLEQADFRGVGLGLSIVRRTAALLDHPVTVRSRPAHGSMFAVSVPVMANGHDTAETAEQISGSTRIT